MTEPVAPASAGAPAIWVGPEARPDLAAAVMRAGGKLQPAPRAEVFVWTGDDPPLLARMLHPGVRWVQLCAAGVDTWLAEGLLDGTRVWTGAQGVAARQIAEHVVCLMLAAARELPRRIRAEQWGEAGGQTLAGTRAGIFGAGAVGRAVAQLLAQFGVSSTALTRSGRTVREAARSVGPGGLDRLMRESDWVVIAAPSTPETRGRIGRHELSLMQPGAWLVNVSRGDIVDTPALVDALTAGRIAGAALDVTDPEPLTGAHPLWSLPNVIITPHTATTPSMHATELADRVAENVVRFRAGRGLIGAIDLARGY